MLTLLACTAGRPASILAAGGDMGSPAAPGEAWEAAEIGGAEKAEPAAEWASSDDVKSEGEIAASADKEQKTETASSADTKLNPEGVLALLDVMDAVAALHPDFEERAETFRGMDEEKLETALEEERKRNEEDEALRSAIDDMLNTMTYQVYFTRFRNVTPELVRDLVLDLPYRERSAPGGIAQMYRELLHKRSAVRAGLERLLAEADMDWVYETAERWAPEEDREIPTIYLIYDSNAGSYTAQGIPFFNLCGDLPIERLDSDDDGSALLEAQGTMAHELQHVLARPYLYPQSRPSRTWREVWVDRVTRGLVSEGVAIHCNPPTGIKKEIYEDRVVLSALVARLNELLIALGENKMTEEEVQEWNRANYHSFAQSLLREHFEKKHSGDELEAKVREHMPLRPDMAHALGWWMVSRISGRGARPDAAISLLKDPYPVYSLYNEACTENCEGLRIDPEAIEYLRSVHDTPE
jgi:hypothetical protein